MEWTGNWGKPFNEVIFLKPCINDTKEPTPCVTILYIQKKFMRQLCWQTPLISY